MDEFPPPLMPLKRSLNKQRRHTSQQGHCILLNNLFVAFLPHFSRGLLLERNSFKKKREKYAGNEKKID